MKTKEEKNIIGAGMFEYPKETLEEMKREIKNVHCNYEVSMFGKYKHTDINSSVLNKFATFLEFFTEHIEFENIHKEDILAFVNNNSQELRDMFFCAVNVDAFDNDVFFPYSTYYELDKNFHLIRKIKLFNESIDTIISMTFLFSDMICVLWEKYKKESLNYKFFAPRGLSLSTAEGEKIFPDEQGLIPREYFVWSNESRS